MATDTKKLNHTMLRLRKSTKEKLRDIASRRRWTLAETTDAIADAFLEQEVAPRRKRTAKTAAA